MVEKQNILKWADNGRSWLLLVNQKEDHVEVFNRENINGMAQILGYKHEKDKIICEIKLNPDIVPIQGMDVEGFLKDFQLFIGSMEPIESWEDISHYLGVSIPEARIFLWKWKPGEAEKLERMEKEKIN